uniref:lysozyme n=1 Tax=Simulium vittatum TaxID=7192 RepID=B5M0V6_SIMVI|nr:salivary lysozyme [Simulium vittatum]
MNIFIIVTGIFLLGWNSPVEAKQFKTDCELVRALRQNGFPETQLRDWACLIFAESSRQTQLTHKNRNGSTDYGLFQINSKYWCGTGKKGGDCNVRCEDLLDDNIVDDSKCAKKIFKRHGFKAWYGWQSKCQGKALPNISQC